MNEKYEYAGRPLNKRLARPLIRKLYLGKDYHTINEIKERVLQYHLDQGGIPPTIKSLRGVIYKILAKWEKEDKAGRSEEDKELWIILPSADDDNIERELAHQESIDIFEEIKARDERIERLEKILLFLINSAASPDYLYQSPDKMLKSFLSPHTAERVGKLLKEYESVEKVLQEFLSICEERLLRSNDK